VSVCECVCVCVRGERNSILMAECGWREGAFGRVNNMH